MRKSFPLYRSFAVVMVVVSLLVSAVLAFSQTYRGADQRSSNADRVAAEQVALSAEKVNELLRNEAGLMLEFKRTLVRKAYEQGRYLDWADLTDDAVFLLVQQDASIRVLATREIEMRGYVRALPTQEEIERSRIQQLQAGARREPPNRTQEGIYWSSHEMEARNATPQRPGTPGAAPVPERQPAPEQSPQREDPRRQLQRAAIEQNSTLRHRDVPTMSRIAPDELPDLLASGSVMPAASRSSFGTGLPGESASSLSSGGLPQFGMQPDLFSSYDSQLPAPSGPVSPPTQASADQKSFATRPLSTQRRDPPLIYHRPNPYADVPSLYDLYTQVVNRPTLQRFGADIFINGSGNSDLLPIDLPAGPDYVLGPGDGIQIEIWGGVSQRLERTVDRQGRIALPEVGAIMVAGRSLGDVQRQVQAALRTQFRYIQADVSLSRLRSVRVYVVGDVQRPGAYDVSSLSTPLNVLLEAGGPTSRGSLRMVRHYRGKELVQNVDLYDLILHGLRADVQRLEPGDTILVPPAGPQVTVKGMIRRPAVYEINGEANLAEVLELAGGVLTSGTLRHIDVERVQAHQGRTMVSLDLPETNDQAAVLKAMEAFKVQDGDGIRISPILPYSDKTVFLDGHVFHPGKYPYREGMKVTDLIKSDVDLLPEPSRRHAEIIRLNPPDFKPVVLAFNLGDALGGKSEAPALKPFDTVRVFGRYDFEDLPEIVVSGEVRMPGQMLTNGETRIRDAVYLAGGLTPEAKLDEAQIYRFEPGGRIKVLSVNLERALAGEVDNVVLESRDRVVIHRSLSKVDPSTVTVQGEVARPGKYPLGENMTAADLVKAAGGFKRGAYTRSADLTRYAVENGKKIVGDHQEVPIGKAMAGVADNDLRLFDGDVLTVRQLAGWKEVGASMAVQGEVQHVGTYGIQTGEKLSSVLKRAGGFTAAAYPYGAVLERVQVREFAEKNRQEMIHRIESGQSVKVSGDATGGEQAVVVQAAMQQQQQVLTSLRNQTPSGRLVIRISSDIARWQNTAADIEVRPGDVLLIPKRPTFILISGQVYNSSAVSFSPGRSAGWYLQQAGGPTNLADKKSIFIIRADGSVVGRIGGGSGFWRGNVLSTRLEPGDSIVVPEKFISGSSTWKSLMTTATFVSSMAIAARVATSF